MLKEVRAIIGWWREHYNNVRPHNVGVSPNQCPEEIIPSWPIGSAPPHAQLGIRIYFELASNSDHSSQLVQFDAVPTELELT